MILKTEAIVLSSRPFSKTSRMVAWLTRDAGRIVTPVKGACRSKSLFLGQIDIGYRSELLYYERESNGVHNIRETTPLDWREGLHSNWKSSVAAGYICSLTSQSVETLVDSVGLFDDLDSSLKKLSEGANPLDVVIAYEFALLNHLGLRPSFDSCVDCRFAGAANHQCRFIIPSGSLGCFEKDDFNKGYNTVALSNELLTALKWVMGGAPQSKFPRGIALGVRRFLGIFMAHHLDISLYSRRAAFAWLDYKL